MTAASRTHAVVVRAIGCGSGGGAPVGRRWRRVPSTRALPGWAAGAAGPTGLGGAGVRSVLSLIAHAAFQATPHSPPPRSVLIVHGRYGRLVPIMHRCGLSDHAALRLAKPG